MKMYKASNLTSKTTEADQTKLVSALRGVRGVDKATLHPDSSEIEIRGRDNKDPAKADIAAAASKVGFELAK